MDKLDDREKQIKMAVLEEIKEMIRGILPEEIEMSEPMMEETPEQEMELPPLDELPEMGAEKVTVIAEDTEGLKEGLDQAGELVEEMPEDKDAMLAAMKEKLARMKG